MRDLGQTKASPGTAGQRRGEDTCAPPNPGERTSPASHSGRRGSPPPAPCPLPPAHRSRLTWFTGIETTADIRAPSGNSTPPRGRGPGTGSGHPRKQRQHGGHGESRRHTEGPWQIQAGGCNPDSACLCGWRLGNGADLSLPPATTPPDLPSTLSPGTRAPLRAPPCVLRVLRVSPGTQPRAEAGAPAPTPAQPPERQGLARAAPLGRRFYDPPRALRRASPGPTPRTRLKARRNALSVR